MDGSFVCIPQENGTSCGESQSGEKRLHRPFDFEANIDATEYKYVVLGLTFIRYISDTFEEHRDTLLAWEGDYAGANLEGPDEHKAENVFWMSAEAHWSHLQVRVCSPPLATTPASFMAEA